MRTTLIHIRPLDKTTGSRIDVRIGDGGSADSFGMLGQEWQPAVSRHPLLSQETFDEDLSGKVQAGRVTFAINLAALRGIESPQRLYWRSAPVTIYSDESALDAGAAAEFTGLATEARVDLDSLVLTVTGEVSTALLEKPLLTLTWTGGGGALGDAAKRGVLKPAGFGSVFSCEPVWFDETRNIGCLDGYGNTVSIDWLGEGGASFGARVANYADYASLVAAYDAGAIGRGQWATCVAEGLVVVGAPPEGRITCHAVFGAALPGTWMRRILETHAGISTGSLITADFDALDAAVPYPTAFWTAEQRGCRDLLESIAGSCNASPVITLQGKVTVIRAFGGTVASTLDRSGSIDPRPLNWKAADTQAPWHKLTARTARPGVVLSTEEIFYEDEIRPVVDYDAGRIFRRGDVAQNPANGNEYLYTNENAAAGTALTNATYWTLLRQGPTRGAPTGTLVAGVPAEELTAASAAAAEAIADLQPAVAGNSTTIRQLDTSRSELARLAMKAVLEARRQRTVNRDVTITVDPASGKYRIDALDATNDRLNTALLLIDAVEGRINLTATRVETQDMILAAGLTPAGEAAFDSLLGRIVILEFDMSTATGQISLRATEVDLDTERGRIDIAEADIDGLQGEILLRVTTSVFEPVVDRLASVEVRLSTTPDGATLSQSLSSIKATADGTAKQSLWNIINAREARKYALQRVATINDDLNVRTSGLDAALAEAKRVLQVAVDANSASITATQRAMIDGLSAEALVRTQLTTTVSGHTATLVQQAASIDGIKASWTLAFDIDGNIAGFTLIGSAEGPAELGLFNTDLKMGTGRIIFDNGSHMRVEGLGFGTTSQFMEWYGPTLASPSLCSTANALSYKTVAGVEWTAASIAGPIAGVPAATVAGYTRNVDRGAWSGSGVAYVIGDEVQNQSSTWGCIVAHTSTGGNGPPALPTTSNTNWRLRAKVGDTGATGPAAITGFLTNEAHTLPAASDGTVSSYTGASGSFAVYSGETDVSASFALSTQSNPQTLTVGYAGLGYSVTGGFDAGADTATLTIRATGSGDYSGVVIDKVFSLGKSKTGGAGTPGTNAKLLYLYADRPVITYDAAGSPSPSTQTTVFTIQPQGLSSASYKVAATDADGTVVNVYANFNGTGLTDNGDNTMQTTATSFNLTAAQFNSARGSSKGLIVTVSHADGVSDKMSVFLVQAGSPGSDGTDGQQVVEAFKRAATLPTTPTGNGTPSGWELNYPTADGNPLWKSRATQQLDGTLVGSWSTPVMQEVIVPAVRAAPVTIMAYGTAGTVTVGLGAGESLTAEAEVSITGLSGACTSDLQIKHQVNGTGGYSNLGTADSAYGDPGEPASLSTYGVYTNSTTVPQIVELQFELTRTPSRTATIVGFGRA